MNETKSKLLARYDPFIKAAPLWSLPYDEGSGGLLTVRPVWIIGDLIDLIEWFGSELRKSNWELNQRRISVLQHYKQLLLSDIAQSFMIEQNGSAVIQYDLLPGSQTDYPKQIHFEKSDLVIQYVYKESFRDPGIFQRSLHCLISFIYTYPESGTLYIRLPKADLKKQDMLIRTGFTLVELTSMFGYSLNIYRIDRAGV